MKWIHIDFWFNKSSFPIRADKAHLDEKQQGEFEQILRRLLTDLQPYYARKFYLYEDIPHCFLALELVADADMEKIKESVAQVEAPFIYKAYVSLQNSGDENNGQSFLDVMSVMTDFYLFRQDNKFSHILHCCLEFMCQTREKELDVYRYMLYQYGGINCRCKSVFKWHSWPWRIWLWLRYRRKI